MKHGSSETTNRYAYDDFYLCAFRRDETTGLKVLDLFADDMLIMEQIKANNRFCRRFRTQDESVFLVKASWQMT